MNKTITRVKMEPIELLLAALLGLFEFICWVINELAGHHVQQQQTKEEPNDTSSSTVENDSNKIDSCQFDKFEIELLTVKQLRSLTGIRSSRYRKADLVAVAMGVIELQPL